jgi:hypothetical protein
MVAEFERSQTPRLLTVKACSWIAVKRFRFRGATFSCLLPSGNGGYNRVAYLILAANGVEACILSDLRTAQIVSAPNNRDDCLDA